MSVLVCLWICALLSLQSCFAQVFRDSPADVVALTNSPATLSCSAPDPAPPSSIAWVHNDIAAASNDRISIVYDSTSGRSEFRISSVNYNDDGIYQCFAEDAQGDIVSSSDTGNFTVQGHPAFAEPLSPVVAPLGGQAVFTCFVLSNPPATVSWVFGVPPQPLVEGGRITISETPPFTLTISNVQAADEGFYECVAENSYGPNITSARLSIGDPPTPLAVLLTPSSPNPLILTLEDDLALRCGLEPGSEPGVLSWLKDGSSLGPPGISQDSQGLLLSVPTVQVEDGGVYTCKADSSDGRAASAMITVEVYVPPIFETVPEDIVTVANRTLNSTPTCQAAGIPQPSISLLRPSGEEVPVVGGAPQFGVLRRNDAGVYVCVASSVAGEERSEFTITVEDIPLITTPPVDTQAGHGQEAIFTCVAVGPPEPSISWLRLDGQLRNGSVQTANELHLFSVTVEDNGSYRCVATNVYGIQTASATLTVLDLPQILSISRPINLLIGQSFTLNCTASGPPTTVISWYHNGTRLDPNLEPNVDFSPPGLLTVTNAAARQTGEYTCNASTSYAYDIAHVDVIVGAPPAIIVPPTDTDLAPGGNSFLSCEASGLPLPLPTWYRTSELGIREQLPIRGDTFVVHTQGLQLSGVVREDSGTYECVVDNVLGSDRQSARVRVEGTPQVLSFSPLVLIAADTYTLTCETVYNFPMADITWTRVDGVPLPPGRFTTDVVGGTLLISPVEADDQAEYTCTAANDYGESSFSAPVTVHVRPSITLPSPQVTAILDADSTLVCPASGRPTPDLQWSLPNGTNPADLQSSSPSNDHYRFDEASGSLTIFGVVQFDAGMYTCMASNLVGNATESVDVVVRGAAPSAAMVTTLSSTVLTVTWQPPPPELSGLLLSYQVEFGVLGTGVGEVRDHLLEQSRQIIVSFLEQATTYEFLVRGIYGGGVRGLNFVVNGTTLEDIPSAPPQAVTITALDEALRIDWQPPSEQDQNGVIIFYNVYFRETPETSSDSFTFTLVVFTPTNLTASQHSFIIEGLAGGQSYDIKLQAATAVGLGPNSTFISETAQTPFPLTLVLAITVPVGSILLLVVCLAVCVGCLCYHRYSSHLGKHSPLMEDRAFEAQQKRRNKTISGPIPGITPSVDTSVPGKFAVRGKDGRILPLHPKVIKQEDVAPPPAPGQTVARVPRDEILPSQQRQGTDSFNPYDLPADSLEGQDIPSRPLVGRIDPYNLPEEGRVQRPSSGVYEEPSNVPRWMVQQSPPGGQLHGSGDLWEGGDEYGEEIDPYAISRSMTMDSYGSYGSSDLREQPILEEEEGEDSDNSSDESQVEDQLSASRNALDLSNDNVSVLPQASGEPVPETTRDNVALIYATVPQSHKTSKRVKMLREQQKRDIKARQDQRKMRERMEREQKKRDSKERKALEKEKKKAQKEQRMRHDLGLDNVVRLHELDLGTQRGRAQAHFIDSATAAIF